jgi:uncharacterized protein (TIGR02145 family)
MKTQKHLIIIFATLILSAFQLSAQVAINTDGSAPDNSAMLDVKSTSKGMLIPRMSQVQISQILSPTDGLMAFCTTDHKFYAFNESLNLWHEFSFGSSTILPYVPPFSCGTPFRDPRDLTIYNTVLIGTQCWFAQNLNIGTKIPGCSNQTNNGVIEKFCYNDDDDANCAIYGGIYQWNEAMQYTTTPGVQGICPPGWHVPTNDEWTTLTTYLGGGSVAGGRMKSTGTLENGTGLWSAPNAGATNSSGFTAFPGGARGYEGCSYFGLAGFASFWSSTQNDFDPNTYAFYRFLYFNNESLSRNYDDKATGFPVRCIKDN